MMIDKDDGPLWSWGDLIAILVALAVLTLGVIMVVHQLSIGNDANG